MEKDSTFIDVGVSHSHTDSPTDKERKKKKRSKTDKSGHKKQPQSSTQLNCLSGILGIFITLTVVLTVLLFLYVTRLNADETAGPEFAVAVLKDASGQFPNVEGTIRFYQEGDAVRIVGKVSGLSAKAQHGLHIYEWTDEEGKSHSQNLGAIYNPRHVRHSCPEDDARRAGDLGNLEADANGIARYERIDNMISLKGLNSIMGRPVVMHTGKDDCITQPQGNSGGVMLEGLVVVAQPDSSSLDKSNTLQVLGSQQQQQREQQMVHSTTVHIPAQDGDLERQGQPAKEGLPLVNEDDSGREKEVKDGRERMAKERSDKDKKDKDTKAKKEKDAKEKQEKLEKQRLDKEKREKEDQERREKEDKEAKDREEKEVKDREEEEQREREKRDKEDRERREQRERERRERREREQREHEERMQRERDERDKREREDREREDREREERERRDREERAKRDRERKEKKEKEAQNPPNTDPANPFGGAPPFGGPPFGGFGAQPDPFQPPPLNPPPGEDPQAKEERERQEREDKEKKDKEEKEKKDKEDKEKKDKEEKEKKEKPKKDKEEADKKAGGPHPPDSSDRMKKARENRERRKKEAEERRKQRQDKMNALPPLIPDPNVPLGFTAGGSPPPPGGMMGGGMMGSMFPGGPPGAPMNMLNTDEFSPMGAPPPDGGGPQPDLERKKDEGKSEEQKKEEQRRKDQDKKREERRADLEKRREERKKKRQDDEKKKEEDKKKQDEQKSHDNASGGGELPVVRPSGRHGKKKEDKQQPAKPRSLKDEIDQLFGGPGGPNPFGANDPFAQMFGGPPFGANGGDGAPGNPNDPFGGLFNAFGMPGMMPGDNPMGEPQSPSNRHKARHSREPNKYNTALINADPVPTDSGDPLKAAADGGNVLKDPFDGASPFGIDPFGDVGKNKGDIFSSPDMMRAMGMGLPSGMGGMFGGPPMGGPLGGMPPPNLLEVPRLEPANPRLHRPSPTKRSGSNNGDGGLHPPSLKMSGIEAKDLEREPDRPDRRPKVVSKGVPPVIPERSHGPAQTSRTEKGVAERMKANGLPSSETLHKMNKRLKDGNHASSIDGEERAAKGPTGHHQEKRKHHTPDMN